MLRIGIALLACALAAGPARAATLPEIRSAVVRISATSQAANYKVPWVPGNIGGGTGAGFVIAGNLVMTNAHVVSDARFLTVSKEDDPKKYVASVKHIAHDADLAVLSIDDESFFEATKPLELDGLPEIESAVSVYGYPVGGDRLSVTRGIVSRIDFQAYSHSSVDAHLTIQIDAAINPGNSGGPVMQDGKVVGVAFQGYSGDVAQNVGYMIPTPVIERFLKDIEDGTYDRYMDISITTFNLQNPAMRAALGLKDDDSGVFVSEVISAGSSAGVLKKGDVLLSIDGHPISSDSFVELDGARVQMAEVVERKFKGDDVKFDILRDKQPMTVSVKLDQPWPFQLQSNAYDMAPRFVLFGGLLFQPLSRDFLQANPVKDLRARFFYDYFISEEIYRRHPEVVILSEVLSDPINAYLGEFQHRIVESVNAKPIRTLADLAAALAEPAEEYVIHMLGEGRPIVLERDAVQAAQERIKTRYNVTKEQNLEEKP